MLGPDLETFGDDLGAANWEHDLDGLEALTPRYSLDQLAAAGLRLLEADRGSTGRLPESRTRRWSR